MTERKFTKKEFEDCPRFMPIERDESYRLFDIVDTERLDYVDFIMPYSDVKECERDCNLLNVIDYLLKELQSDV